jgi:hypothetical protein
MTTLDIAPLGENVFQLERGDGVRKAGKDDAVMIRFGGIETDFTRDKISENPTLPFALEGENLETLLVTHSGSYGQVDARQTLSDAIIVVISKMTLGQKVLVEEEYQEHQNMPKKGGRIW